MEHFLPRCLLIDPSDVILEGDAMSRGCGDPEQTAIDFNAENL
jgi:hypothetical protein